MNVSRKRGRSRSQRPAGAKKRRQQVPAVLQLRAPEKNAVDNQIVSEFNTTGGFTLLNGTVPGDNVVNRKGRKISMVSSMLRGWVTFNNSGGTPPSNDYLRLIIFYDRQPNGAAPSIADLLTNTDSAGSTSSDAYSMLNISNADRFKILVDEYWGIPTQIPSAGSGATQEAQVLQDRKPISIKRFTKLGGMETHYNAGTAGTIADITTGSLYCLCLGTRASTDAQWTFIGRHRLRFHDQ